MANANSIEAKGVDRRVVFDGATVAIHPDVFARLRAKLLRRHGADLVIPLEDIVAVELVPSTTVWNGYVRFTLADEDEGDRPAPPSAGAAVKLASRNPNAVMFSRYHASAFAELHDAVAAAIEARDA